MTSSIKCDDALDSDMPDMLGGVIGTITDHQGEVLEGVRGRIELGQLVLSHSSLAQPIRICIDEDAGVLKTHDAERQAMLDRIEEYRHHNLTRGSPEDDAVLRVLEHASTGLPIYIIRDNPHNIFGFGTRTFICIRAELLEDIVCLFHELGHAAGLTHRELRGSGTRQRIAALTGEEEVVLGIQDKLFGEELNVAATELIHRLRYIRLEDRGVSVEEFMTLVMFEVCRLMDLSLDDFEQREMARRTLLELMNEGRGIGGVVEVGADGERVIIIEGSRYALQDSVVIPCLVNPEAYALAREEVVAAVNRHRDELVDLFPLAEQTLIAEDKSREIRLGKGDSLQAYRLIGSLYKVMMRPVVGAEIPGETDDSEDWAHHR